MNDPFFDTTENTRKQKGKKVSGGIVGGQKAWGGQKAMLEVEIHAKPELDENRTPRGT